MRLFFNSELPGQWSWLFPLAAIGLLAALLALRRRLPLEPRASAILLWAGWVITYGVVFSSAEGIFHPYYLIMLAPAAAALVGIGVASLWNAYRRGGWQAWLLPIALLATAFWQTQVLAPFPTWSAWLTPITVAGALVAALPLAATRFFNERVRSLSPALLAVGLVALVISPLTWAVLPVTAAPANASLPIAGPSALARPNGASWTQVAGWDDSALISYLKANNESYYYILAVTNSQQASSFTLESGSPVLSVAGFMGTDPALTTDKLAAMVADHQLRFVMLTNGSIGTGTLTNYVKSTCSAVDSTLWQSSGNSSDTLGGFPSGSGGGSRGLQLYDCAAR